MRGWDWRDVGMRPLVVPVLALGLGASIAGLSDVGSAIPGVLALCLALAAVRWRETWVGRALVLAAALLTGVSLASAASASGRLPTGRPVLLEGRLASVEVDGRGARGILEVSRVDGVPLRARTRLFWNAPNPRPWAGQEVRLSAELRDDVGAESWGEFDRGAAARARGLRTAGRVLPGSDVPLSPPPGWQRWLTQHREGFGALARTRVADADAAALLGALGAGLRSELGSTWEERFARAGVAHVLSVSGLHVAALALAAAWLLGLLLRCIPGLTLRLDPRRPAALAALPLVWGYVLFTGQQAPAVRSGVMLGALLVGRALQRHTDALDGLALAAGVLLVVDPASVHELSLQLSFTAVAALILLAPRLRRAVPVRPPDPLRHSGWRLLLARGREAVLATTVASAAVTLASLPLVAAAFHRVSLAGVVVNVVALPLCSALTLLAAAAGGAFCLAPPLAAMPLWLGGLAARALLALVRLPPTCPAECCRCRPRWTGRRGYAEAWSASRWGRRIAWLAPLALASALLLPTGLGGASGGNGASGGARRRGAGLAGGHHLLVDGGGVPGGVDPGARIVLPYLRERGIHRLDAVALTHPHPDHALGLLAVLREVPTRVLWLPAGIPGGALIDAVVAAAGSARVERLGAGDVRRLGETTVRVLSPPVNAPALRSINDRSLVLYLSAGGPSLLLPGDAGAETERGLPPLEATVVKVPHHGSRTSSSEALVARSQARVAVFSVGRQHRFGLPAPEVVERWRAAGATVLRTDVHGAIRLHLLPGGVRWETFRGGAGTALLSSTLAIPPTGGAPSSAMNPEELDLAKLSLELHRALGPGEPVGYLRGKAAMRDVLVDTRGFSQLEAESLVDTLELQGYVHFLGDPSRPSEAESRWEFRQPQR
jgi:competence protein ComEC